MEAASEQLPAWAREAELLAHRLVPDFAKAELHCYAMPLSSLQAIGHPFGRMDSLGVFASLLDLQLRDAIGERWKGRGPAVILNDVCPEARDFPEDRVRLAIHEFAHAVPMLHHFAAPLPQAEELGEAAVVARAERLANPEARYANPFTLAAFDFLLHDLAFVRVVCHMAFRAGRLNSDWKTPYFRRTPEIPRLNGVSRYVAAFEAEATHYRRLPFREILAVQPPQAARDLWARDLEAFDEAFEEAGSPSPPSERTGVARVTVAVGDNRKVPMNTIMEKLSGSLKKREADRLSSFAELVKKIAAGKEPDVKRVEQILADTGRTADELAEAVSHRLRRLALREKLDRGPAAEQAKIDAELQIADAKAELEKAEAAYEATIAPLQLEVRNANDAITAAHDAKVELLQTCKDTAIQAELESIAKNLAEVQAKQRSVEDRISRNTQYSIAAAARRDAGTLHPDDAQEAKHAAERVVSLRAELRSLQAEANRLMEEDGKVRLRMLEP